MADMGNHVPVLGDEEPDVVGTEGTDTENTADENDSVLEKLRDSPVGTNDPMIVGDAGPTDVPPGSDGDTDPRIQPD